MERMIQWLAIALVSFVLAAGPASDALNNIVDTEPAAIQLVGGSGGTPGDCC